MRREWIEMPPLYNEYRKSVTSPSMRREWIEISFVNFVVEFLMSPSMRREWIEME